MRWQEAAAQRGEQAQQQQHVAQTPAASVAISGAASVSTAWRPGMAAGLLRSKQQQIEELSHKLKEQQVRALHMHWDALQQAMRPCSTMWRNHHK